MPKKLITKVEDLPKSFCLDNYAGTKNLDACGWAAVLSERQRIQNQYIRPDPDLLLVADKWIRRLFKDPLPQKGSTEPDLTYARFMDKEGPPITHLAVHELYFLISFLELNAFANEAKEYKQFLDDFRDDPNTYTHTHRGLSKSAREFRFMEIDSMDELSQYNSNTGKIHLSVDISCSDEQLIDELKKTLKQARSNFGYNPRKSLYPDETFQKWHQQRVLPYIDLSLWAKANRVSIQNIVYIKAIYPRKERPLDANGSIDYGVISEKTEKLAQKLLSSNTIHPLWRQIQSK